MPARRLDSITALARPMMLIGAVVAACGTARPALRSDGTVVDEVSALHREVNEGARSSASAARLRFVAERGGYEANDWRLTPSQESVNGRITADVVRIGGRVRKAVFFLSSPSGDWTNTTEYFFYENGRTALRVEAHVTVLGYDIDRDRDLPPGPYVLEQRDYSASDGRLVRTETKAFRKPSLEAVNPAHLQRIQAPQYRGISNLPFAALLE